MISSGLSSVLKCLRLTEIFPSCVAAQWLPLDQMLKAIASSNDQILIGPPGLLCSAVTFAHFSLYQEDATLFGEQL
jgi:hypothetical protein